jgi:aryl-alcohol dehydrogenase-like predicted oxidoreductase
MTKSRIGRAGLEVSRIGLGCVTFGREIDERQSLALLDYAFAKGINLFDTAEAYGGEGHASEKILGCVLPACGIRW